MNPMLPTRIQVAFILSLALVACAPTVRVEAPEKPIEINLNVKIEHEIRVRVDKDLDELFDDDAELF